MVPSIGEKVRYFPKFRCNKREISMTVVGAIGGRNLVRYSVAQPLTWGPSFIGPHWSV